MKIGMNLFLWTHRVTPREFPVIAELASAGFDLIEIPNHDYNASEIHALNQELDRHSLSRTLATILGADSNPISPDPSIRRAALHKLQQDIDMAAALGAEALIGPIHSAHKLFTGRGPSEQELAHCADILQRAGEYAQTKGIELCVEFLNRFECYVLNTCEQAHRLMSEINLPNVGILYDTHHAHIEEHSQGTALTENLEAINHVHISESHRGTPGTGTVSWPEVFSALKQGGYNGRVVIEAFGTSNPDIAQAVNIWRNCFTAEEEVYRKGYELIAQGFR